MNFRVKPAGIYKLHDPLTGMYNRVFFGQELPRIEKEAIVPVAIIIADIDGLNFANDTFGYAEGDMLNVCDCLDI